jgi:hypothetical protein
MIFKSFRKFKIIFLDVDHNRIYQCEKSKSKFVVFESQEKRQMCRSGRDEQCLFSKFDFFFSNMSISCSLEYTEF